MIIIAVCPMSRSLRRSCRSASAPAGSASKATGMNSAAESSSTRNGDWVCFWTSHAWATVSIQLPTLLASEPSQIQRNAGCRSTANGPPPARRGGVRNAFTARCSSRDYFDRSLYKRPSAAATSARRMSTFARACRGALRLEQVLVGHLQVQRGRHARARGHIDLLLRPLGHPRLRLGLLEDRLRGEEIGARALPARLGAGARRGQVGHCLLELRLILVLLRIADAPVVERDADVQDQIVARVGAGEAGVRAVVALGNPRDRGEPEEVVVGN